MKPFYFTILTFVIALFLFTRLIAPPNQLDFLDHLWPAGGAEKIASNVTFDAANGLKLDVWNVPGGQAKKPVLVFFYGGGWVNGERGHYGFAARAYATKGFIVVVPDYRKVPQIRFPVFNQDGATAVRWVHDNIAKYGGDPENVALAGHSAGAYIAMMLTLDPSYLSAVGVDPSIIRATAGLSGPYDFYPYDSRRSIDAMIAWPRPSETQPIAYARRNAPPIIVLTGTADDTVKPRNAILLARKLGKLGAPVEFKAYDDLSHEDVVMALSRPFRDKAPVLRDSADFLMRAMQKPK